MQVRGLLVEVGILVFSCQVSGFVWFVVVLQRPGAGFVPGLVVVFVRSMLAVTSKPDGPVRQNHDYQLIGWSSSSVIEESLV